MKKLNKKGFTMVELVIVISVIAILSAVMIPTFSGVLKKAKDSAALQEARNAYTDYLAVEEFDYAEDYKANINIAFKASNDRYVAVVAGVLATKSCETEAEVLAAWGYNANEYKLTEKTTDTSVYYIAEKKA